MKRPGPRYALLAVPTGKASVKPRKPLALSSGWIVRFPCFVSVSAPYVPAPRIGGFSFALRTWFNG